MLEGRARKAGRESWPFRESRAWRSRGPVFGERCRRFPHGYANDGQSLLHSLVEDQLRDAFDGRIAIEQIYRLSELLQRGDERVVVPEQHLVIELPVDPTFDDPLDVAEVTDHVAVVE